MSEISQRVGVRYLELDAEPEDHSLEYILEILCQEFEMIDHTDVVDALEEAGIFAEHDPEQPAN